MTIHPSSTGTGAPVFETLRRVTVDCGGRLRGPARLDETDTAQGAIPQLTNPFPETAGQSSLGSGPHDSVVIHRHCSREICGTRQCSAVQNGTADQSDRSISKYIS